MMKQIRLRFIRIALLALSLAMLLVAGAINAVHIVSTVNEQRETLQYLTESQNNYSKKKQGGGFVSDNQKKEFPATADSFQHSSNLMLFAFCNCNRSKDDWVFRAVMAGIFLDFRMKRWKYFG